MRRKTKATILLIIGFYLFFVNTIITLFIPIKTPMVPNPYEIEPTPIDPATYWRVWLALQGWQTILVATVGLFLIIIGGRYFVIKQQIIS